MRVITWNVNGIRAIMQKNAFIDMLETYEPDVLCLQETKMDDPSSIYKTLIDAGHFADVNSTQSITKSGYSGTAILSRYPLDNIAPHALLPSLPENINDEGRLTISLIKKSKILIICVYTPNSGEKLARLEYRTQEWDSHFRDLVDAATKKYKNVIICGDLNVALTEFDLHDPKRGAKAAGYTPQERESITRFFEKTKYVDTFRIMHPNAKQNPGYTYWSYRGNARANNKGWRIDYILASPMFAKSNEIVSVDVLEYNGSDHAAVCMDVKIKRAQK